VLPTVSWHRDEYDALGVPFGSRGDLLDEHLGAWEVLWRDTPASFEGAHYRFSDVWFEPKAYRPGGPVLWFGGSSVHERLLRRLVRYGDGFNPLGSPSDGELARLRAALVDAGRAPDALELVGGIRGTFPDAKSVADLPRALEAIPAQLERGYTSICFKPSQFTDELDAVGPLCRELVRRVERLQA
jgi:alkanesulfonate monooxygenase SsuD/methylene tetrahydromethanopterin reductase-like flavin-dependent oxidoreductase (luciferase family)